MQRIQSLSLGFVMTLFGVFVLESHSLAASDFEIGTESAIEASAYDVQIVRPSKSGRVYLIKKDEPALPEVGRIFLLKDSSTPVMAFRVLKTYSKSNQIAAKKVRVYPHFEKLVRQSRYRSYEKKGDISLIPKQTHQDVEDLQDLESAGDGLDLEQSVVPPPPSIEEIPPVVEVPLEEPLPQPPAEPEPLEAPESSLELEPTPTPTPSPVPKTEIQDPGEQDTEIRDDDGEDEEAHKDYFPNGLSLSVGVLQNSTIPGPTLKAGTGLFYSRNIAYEIFYSEPKKRDSFSLEGGFYYYKSAGEVDGVSVSYTMMPLVGQGRYNVPLSDHIQLYLYGGLIYNQVIGNIGSTEFEIESKKTISPAIGAGLFIQTGPNWYLRLNLGIESLAAGIMLRF